MSTLQPHSARLAALRAELKSRDLDGFVVPIVDEYMSEYVGSYAQRMAWLTGFGGSAGSAVVLTGKAGDKAAVFVDGRYTLQVKDQVSGADYAYVGVPQSSPAAWLEETAPAGARIGYDAWLHTVDWVSTTRAALAEKGIELVAVASNPVDAVWQDQPAPSTAPAVPHPEEFSGRNAADKRAEIADWLTAKGLDATVVTALDSIAWLLNMRGSDVERTPVALAYTILNADGTADLFMAPEKVTPELVQHLGNAVRIHDRAAFESGLDALKGKKVAVDPERAVAAIFDRLEQAGASIRRHRDPTVLAKAVKNPVEMAGHRAAQARDGAALTRFLRWVAEEAPKGGLDELKASDKLQALRAEGGLLVDLSFDTISGAGPNGAVVHYRADESTNRPLEMNSLYLVDSGGQYRDGTTDVTRTLAIGTPTDEMIRRYTQVLKGHIALATAVFPEGTAGSQLDTLARQYLWADGVDYAHGTGHGVGSFLSVHEGPQRIAKAAGGQAGTGEPLKAGMILSNEPGYYKTGEFGIRIENLVVVEPREIPDAEHQMLGFDTLTFAPLERNLIDAHMLTEAERHWVNAYHAKVMDVLGPELEADDRAWLANECRPLEAR